MADRPPARSPRQDAQLCVLLLAMKARAGDRPEPRDVTRALRRIEASLGASDPLTLAARRFGVRILAAGLARALPPAELRAAGDRLMAALRKSVAVPSAPPHPPQHPAPHPAPLAAITGRSARVILLDDYRLQSEPRP